MFAKLRAKYWRFQFNRIRRLRARLVMRNFNLSDVADAYEHKAIMAEWQVSNG